MQQSQTPGGNGIWDLFIMFSTAYTIFLVMIATINLILVYSKEIPEVLMQRIVLMNLILWTASLTMFATLTQVQITTISNVVFVVLNLVAYLLIRNKPSVQE